MFRPSTSRGLPAFGCAESGNAVTVSIRSIVSSIGAGPTAQFTPTIVAPRRSQLGREQLRRRAVQRVAVLLGRHLRDDRQIGHAADRVDRRSDLVEVAERLEDEQVDSAFGERPCLLPEVFACFVDAGLAPRLDPDAERTDRSSDVRPIARGGARQARPLAIDLGSLSDKPNAPSLMRFAPKVFVSTTSAPARHSRRARSATSSGCVRFSASKLLLMNTPRV